MLCRISTNFSVLSRSKGQIAHALLTRPPLMRKPKSSHPFDLNVLCTPPALILSQDRTLSEYIFYIFSSLISRSFGSRLLRSRSSGIYLLLAWIDVFVFSLLFCCLIFKDRSRYPLSSGQPIYYTTFSPLCQGGWVNLFCKWYVNECQLLSDGLTLII